MDPLTKAREAFLNLIADASEWEEDPDGDMNDAGAMIDLTTYKLRTGRMQLEELAEALGIKRAYDESVKDAIDRAVQEPAQP